ncbi:MAG: N-acetyltransferase [Cyclobacteriaceae bacterium]|nr:N-acetyltransferase [Cyclobacteriaceae bacterium]
MAALTFRHATEQDLPTIVAIYNSVIPGRMVTADTEPVSVESRRAWYHNHNPQKRPLYIISDGDTIIGWVSLESFYGRPAYNHTAEVSIYLDEAARGKGYGKEILKTIIDQAPAFGVKSLLGYIFAHNEPSLKLFKSFGFEQWALFPNVAILDGVERSLIIVGKRVAP